MESVEQQQQRDVHRSREDHSPVAAAAATEGSASSSSSSTFSSATPAHHSQLKPALKAYRPSPLRRPSNPPPPMIIEGPTPKNADDADHTCDNFQLLWEKDPNLRTPTLTPVPDGASAPSPAPPPPATKSVSFKDKKSAQCMIYVEPEDANLHDDSHTFDNFDRLWEKDPDFAGGDVSFHAVPSKVVHQLQEPGTPVSELLKIDRCDMIQKHVVTVVNSTASSSAPSVSPSSSSESRLCKSNVVYDPVAQQDRRLSFEFSYDIRSQNEEDGTADKTIRNAGVVVRCDVQVQVALKVEPMQDPERKFLFLFHHNVRVFSDFKLESEASVVQDSTMEVADSLPDEFSSLAEPGVAITHYRVTHHLVVLHRWAVAATPKAVLQRRMSTSQTLAHQDYFQLQEQQLVMDDERQHESDEGEGGGAMRQTRASRRRSLQRSNSK